jgi:YHS domain-containing protein
MVTPHMARRLGLAAALALFAFAAGPARAGLPDGLPALPSLGEQVHRDGLSGLALDGYDPVAYHVAGRPLAGQPRFEAEWGGAVWRFSSEANRRAFLTDPESFAPRFNGYDPVGVSHARPVESDPHLFALVRGQLFLFRSAENRRAFLGEDRLRQQAEARWPAVQRQLTR